jgi:DNA-binding transcriptional LysR family regulator
MICIDYMNISALDLNLLKAFSALYQHRNVTRAAATIGLAQPSMSNALARLRAVFEDELFVKSPQGMVPTTRAESLAPTVMAALDLIAQALSDDMPFDPLTTSATVTIAAPDNLVLSIAPNLAAKLAKVAPRFDLRFVPFEKDSVFAALDSGMADIALSRFSAIPARFYQRAWLTDRFVVIAREGHPAVQNGLSLDGFCHADHVLVSFRADARGAIDDSLAALGRQRNIAMVVSQFAVVPDIIARTDYLATIPKSVANHLADRARCVCLPLPLDQEEWNNQIIWSSQTNADPAKRFAVEAIQGLRAAP